MKAIAVCALLFYGVLNVPIHMPTRRDRWRTKSEENDKRTENHKRSKTMCKLFDIQLSTLSSFIAHLLLSMRFHLNQSSCAAANQLHGILFTFARRLLFAHIVWCIVSVWLCCGCCLRRWFSATCNCVFISFYFDGFSCAMRPWWCVFIKGLWCVIQPVNWGQRRVWLQAKRLYGIELWIYLQAYSFAWYLYVQSDFKRQTIKTPTSMLRISGWSKVLRFFVGARHFFSLALNTWIMKLGPSQNIHIHLNIRRKPQHWANAKRRHTPHRESYLHFFSLNISSVQRRACHLLVRLPTFHVDWRSVWQNGQKTYSILNCMWHIRE